MNYVKNKMVEIDFGFEKIIDAINYKIEDEIFKEKVKKAEDKYRERFINRLKERKLKK